ncbi:MAG: RNA polymerase sigma factor [Planctomycetaceae bacterium]
MQRRDDASHRAYAILYKRHAPKVLAFLATRLRDRNVANDVCQQVWLKVWEKISTQFDGRHFRGWIFQIARNQLIDDRRRQRANNLPDEFDPADSNWDPADSEIDDRAEHLLPCVEALDEDRRSIVQFRLTGQSFEDISESLGIPPNTAMTRFHRAKDQLRDCIERRSS